MLFLHAAHLADHSLLEKYFNLSIDYQENLSINGGIVRNLLPKGSLKPGRLLALLDNVEMHPIRNNIHITVLIL